MSERIATHSVRDLRDALDAAEHDLANGVPGARFTVNYNRRVLESMAYTVAADLIDAREESDAQRTRADDAEAECARLRAEVDAAHERSARWQTERAEAIVLRAIVEGRAAPPTEAEQRAHAATGGRWRARLSHGGIYIARYPDAAILDHVGATWWAIDRDDNNVAWPTVTP